jgi:hypothetical protein
MSNFKVGDVCDFMGLEVVVLQFTSGAAYPIRANSKEGHYFYLTEDGRANVAHTKPSLVLKHRPKKKVTLVRWINVYKNCAGPTVWSTEELADKYAYPDRIACVQVTGEYEVEQ